MKKLNIIGTIFGTSGYCAHTRGLANALNKLCDVKITTPLVPGWELQCNDQEMKMIQKQDTPEYTNLIIDLPHNWLPHLRKKNNIGFLVWEGDKIPKSWLEIINDDRVSQVWVPSQHVKDAIIKTENESLRTTDLILKDNFKIKIVPHGVDLSVFKPKKVDKHMFTFLCNKGFRNELDRGGMQHAIKAFMQEFTKDEATLMLKLNPAYAMPPEQLMLLMTKYWQETGKPASDIPLISYTYDNMTPEGLCDLYNKSDVLLNPTEAEAFSLPTIEAFSCFKCAIVTNFGGQTDYVNETNGWLVDYKLHEVQHDLLYEGIFHASPDIIHLRKCMREAYENPEILKAKSEKAYETAQKYTWLSSASKGIECLNELK